MAVAAGALTVGREVPGRSPGFSLARHPCQDLPSFYKEKAHWGFLHEPKDLYRLRNLGTAYGGIRSIS